MEFREGEQWPVVGGLVVVGLWMAQALQQRHTRSHGSTPTARRTKSQEKGGRSTWQRALRDGSSPGTPAIDATAAERLSDRTLWVSDVTSAPFVDLGTRDHAISLLDGVATAMTEIADALQVCGDRAASQHMIWAKDTCLDTMELLAEDVA